MLSTMGGGLPITEAISLALARASFHHDGPDPEGAAPAGGCVPKGGGNAVLGGGWEISGNVAGGGTDTLVAEGGGPNGCKGGA